MINAIDPIYTLCTFGFMVNKYNLISGYSWPSSPAHKSGSDW